MNIQVARWGIRSLPLLVLTFKKTKKLSVEDEAIETQARAYGPGQAAPGGRVNRRRLQLNYINLARRPCS